MAAFHMSEMIANALCLLLDKVTLPSSTISHHTKVSFHLRANASLHRSSSQRLTLANVGLGKSWARFRSELCGIFQPLIGSCPESGQLWVHWEGGGGTDVFIPVHWFIFQGAVLNSWPKRRCFSFRAVNIGIVMTVSMVCSYLTWTQAETNFHSIFSCHPHQHPPLQSKRRLIFCNCIGPALVVNSVSVFPLPNSLTGAITYKALTSYTSRH